MARYIAMFDLVRDGAVNPTPRRVPADPLERTDHLKAAGYYFDASQVGVLRAAARGAARRADPQPQVAALVAELNEGQPRPLPPAST